MTEPLVTNLPLKLKNRLRDRARAKRTSMSAVVRRALARELNWEPQPAPPGRNRVLAAMRDAGLPMSARELARQLDLSRVGVHVHLNALMATGLIRRCPTKYGRYEVVTATPAEEC